MTKTTFALAIITAGLLATGPAFADMMKFKVTLDGKSVVPPIETKANGTADVTVDTTAKTITWTIKSADLSGPPVAAHFHGPADVGADAPPEIDISKMVDTGTAPITDDIVAQINAGKVYLNIHTAKFPDGEIRGQVMK